MKSLLKLAAKFPIKDVQLSISPVAEGETVVGVLPDELKRLWGFAMKIKEEGAPKFEAHRAEAERLETEFRARHEAAEENHDHSQCPAQIEAIEAERQKAKKINDEFVKILQIFWSLVKLEFDIADSIVGIREGGQVVTWKNEEPEEETSLTDLSTMLDMLAASYGPSAFDRRPMMARDDLGSVLASILNRS